MPRQRRVTLAAAGGLLLFAAFPPLDLGFLAWFVLVPLLAAIEGESPSRAFGLGVLAGGVAYLAITSWMLAFGILPWILLAAYLSLYVGIFAALSRWITVRRPAWIAVWSIALLWTALEYVRSIGVFGFPWALLGLTQHRYPPVIQIAKVTGVFGVSFLVALGGAALARALISRRLAPTVAPAIIVAAAILWGGPQVQAQNTGSLRVAALQPNVPARVKFDPLLSPGHMETLNRLVAAAHGQGAELVVFPETAIPYDIFGPRGVLREVGHWAGRAGATLIASSLENGVSNIAVAVAPSGQAISRYDKVRLVAFAEYGVQPGQRHEPLWTPLGHVGVAICFESIFPDVGRALVRNGAELLAVITNDGWFDGTSGVEQHAAHSVLRAVETGRWVVRAANTGVTMVIDPAGRVSSRLQPRTESVLVDRAALVRSSTFYSRRGDMFAIAVLVAIAVLALPSAWPAFLGSIRTPAFRQTVAATLLPLIAVWIVMGSASRGIWPGVLLAFVIVLSALRPLHEWGFRVRGFAASLLAGTAVVGVLWGGLALTFRAYDLPAGVPVPDRGWVEGILRQLVVGLAVEGWLRGIVFTPAGQWKGWPIAVAVGAGLGMLLQRGLTAEAMAWALVTGVAFGLIRARTGNALGLVMPHALGNLLFSVVTMVR
ncbi:MAG TPA: apolipoprotein N-acyltransferase [bacterium]|nr:apolipoprotein N-acyltransferase [bacterium]